MVRSKKATRYLFSQFVVPDVSRIRRSDEHLEQVVGYPDDEYYPNEMQKYLFRGEVLRHLRPEQFFRSEEHTSEPQSQ